MIEFALGTGTPTINLLSQLPLITDPMKNGGNTVSNCYIGTNAAGMDTLVGLRIQGVTNNTIGGTTAADRNVISGNGNSGVAISNATATGNKVIGNYIGVNVAGRWRLA